MYLLFALVIFLTFASCQSFVRNSNSHNNILFQYRSDVSLNALQNKDCIHDYYKSIRKAAVTGLLSISLLNGNTPNSVASAVASTSTMATTKHHAVFDEVWKIVNENFVDDTYNNNDWNAVRKDYELKLDQGANEKMITEKMLKQLGDKYTRLLDKKFFESLWEYDAIGVGLLFQSDVGQPLIVSAPPIAGSSGQLAGIKKGDYVYKINEKSTEKMSAMDVLDMLSNDESTALTLEYGPDRKTVELKRSKQKAANPVTYRTQTLSDGKVAGYIKLTEFNSEAVPELKKALVALNEQNTDELALDLRGNTGGGFQFALNIGGMFMDNKNMVTTTGRGTDSSAFSSSYPEGVLYRKPLVVITDGLSASASEVLSGGLHDNCRAVLVGEQTFGKGKIQAVFGLADGEGLTMTVAQYVTPKGTKIQSIGLKPDIAMPATNAYINYMIGGSLPSIDLNKIDFNQANKIIDVCMKNQQ